MTPNAAQSERASARRFPRAPRPPGKLRAPERANARRAVLLQLRVLLRREVFAPELAQLDTGARRTSVYGDRAGDARRQLTDPARGVVWGVRLGSLLMFLGCVLGCARRCWRCSARTGQSIFLPQSAITIGVTQSLSGFPALRRRHRPPASNTLRTLRSTQPTPLPEARGRARPRGARHSALRRRTNPAYEKNILRCTKPKSEQVLLTTAMPRSRGDAEGDGRHRRRARAVSQGVRRDEGRHTHRALSSLGGLSASTLWWRSATKTLRNGNGSKVAPRIRVGEKFASKPIYRLPKPSQLYSRSLREMGC